MIQWPHRIIGQAFARILFLPACLRACEGSCLRFSRTLAAPSRISLAGLLMYSDHSLPFSIRVMRNENFGLALQETSRDGPAETRQGAGMANANRNSRDRGGVRWINISPRTAVASGEQIDASSLSRVHATTATGKRRRGRGAQSVGGSVMRRSLVRFTSDFAIVLCATRGDR
jgi:hypothetical protein